VDIVDARNGQLVKIGKPVTYGGDPNDDYTILVVHWRSPFTRTATVLRRDGRHDEVTMPVKLFPRLTYGPQFPSGDMMVAIYPS